MNAGWDTDPLGTKWATCLQSAIAAPSVHNSQPWRFRLGPHHVDVFVDPSRRLTAIDPMGREAMISVGAAVLNLRVAILAAGRIPLTQLLPSPDEPDLAARITLGAPHQPDATVLALASAIGKRRTNRRPFRDIEVRDEVIDQLDDGRARGSGHAHRRRPGRPRGHLRRGPQCPGRAGPRPALHRRTRELDGVRPDVRRGRAGPVLRPDTRVGRRSDP